MPEIESANTPQQPPRRGRRRKIVIVLLVLTVLGLGDGLGRVLNSDHVRADQAFSEYVAEDAGFRVDFPGRPLVQKQTLDVEGYAVPATVYTRETSRDKQVYFALASDYENLPIDPGRLDPKASMQDVAQSINGARLRSASRSTLGEQKAVEGMLSLPYKGENYDAYMRLAVRGKHMYGVMTIGVPYGDFETFANSFAFGK